MLEVCRDPHSRGFYRLVAEKVPEELIRAALSETKYQAHIGVSENHAAPFLLMKSPALPSSGG
jgi:hypothetical protein